MTSPGPTSGDGAHVEGRAATLTAELRHTQRTTKQLLKLIQHADLPEQDVAVLEQYAQAEIPKARALARASLAGVIPAEGVLILWRRAKQAFNAAAPAVMDMYLEKMERGGACPYSERLLVEAMKGMGMMQPSEPVSDEDRATAIADEEVARMSNDQLMQKLREQAGFEGS